jgi:hypothetical protein
MELRFECTVGKLEDDFSSSPLKPELREVGVYASFAENKGPHVRFTMPGPCPLRIGDVLTITITSNQ